MAGEDLTNRNRIYGTIGANQQGKSKLAEKDGEDIAGLHERHQRPGEQQQSDRRSGQDRFAPYAVGEPRHDQDDGEQDRHVGRVDEKRGACSNIGDELQPCDDIDEYQVEADGVDETDADDLQHLQWMFAQRPKQRKARYCRRLVERHASPQEKADTTH